MNRLGALPSIPGVNPYKKGKTKAKSHSSGNSVLGNAYSGQVSGTKIADRVNQGKSMLKKGRRQSASKRFSLMP